MAKAQKVLSQEEVGHLANLTRLRLTAKEIKKYQKQLTETLDYIENLNEIKTGGVLPDYYTVKAKNVYQEDKIDTSRMLSHKEALSNAKKKKNSQFVVKRIIF